MISNLPKTITRTASKQTFFTIRYLADRDKVNDAYRAYAYFRWVDDSLDAKVGSQSARTLFIQRQRSLLEKCCAGDAPQGVCPEERILVELVANSSGIQSSLHTYLYNMMEVMTFDAGRRGRLITQAELDRYTYLLASAVTEAMHYFIGYNCPCPHDETRYLAVSAAHITHMLRDTCDDVRAGYFNIPLEFLQEHHLHPQDVGSQAYRAWVASRVGLAKRYFKYGKGYLNRVANLRCRMAGFAYTVRFEFLLDTIERDDFRLRPAYKEEKILGRDWQMLWLAFITSLGLNKGNFTSQIANLPSMEKRS
jgi:phytoene/squalene synthetase